VAFHAVVGPRTYIFNGYVYSQLCNICATAITPPICIYNVVCVWCETGVEKNPYSNRGRPAGRQSFSDV